jgi:hypothetical protein
MGRYKTGGTVWDDVGRCGTMWDDVGRCGTVWDGVEWYGTVGAVEDGDGREGDAIRIGIFTV